MPNRGFTKEEMQKIIDWIKSHNWTCASCEKRMWRLQRMRLGVVVPESVAEMEAVEFIRTALIICRNCGYIRLFSADEILGANEDG